MAQAGFTAKSAAALVCIAQIMELENAKTEAQAEARSLAAELESLRTEGPAESSGVCHIHTYTPSLTRSETLTAFLRMCHS